MAVDSIVKYSLRDQFSHCALCFKQNVDFNLLKGEVCHFFASSGTKSNCKSYSFSSVCYWFTQ